MPRITKPSPDPYRVKFHPCYRWTRDIRVTDDHRLFAFHPSFRSWTKEQHAARALRWLEIGRRLNALFYELAAKALVEYGDHGPSISGCIREHFPEPVKRRLRLAAHGSSEAFDRSLAHWRATGKHVTTWRTVYHAK